jgi:hypothetical protein
MVFSSGPSSGPSSGSGELASGSLALVIRLSRDRLEQPKKYSFLESALQRQEQPT